MCKFRSSKQFVVALRHSILSDELILSADEILEKNRPHSLRRPRGSKSQTDFHFAGGPSGAVSPLIRLVIPLDRSALSIT